jgi:spore coat protein JB
MNSTERTLTEAAFVADDLRLFLDTHPTNKKARSDYRAAADVVEQQKKKLGYAVNALDAGKGCIWDWTSTPWPWEKED